MTEYGSICNGIFARKTNAKFIPSIIDLSYGGNGDELIKDGLVRRVYDQYANALNKKNINPAPTSQKFRRDLKEIFDSTVLPTNINDRVLICLDLTRKYMDELQKEFHDLKSFRVFRRKQIKAPSYVTETTDML